jgi:hypothetical protein
MQRICTNSGNARYLGASHRTRLQPSPSSPPPALLSRLPRLKSPNHQQQQQACRAPLQCRAEKQPGSGGSGQQAAAAAPPAPPPPELVGEDAAVFRLEDQSLRSWAMFTALLAGVSALLYPASGVS